MLGDYVRNYAPGVRLAVPKLHHRPSVAMGEIGAAIAGVDRADLTLVGSSLGGFYATVAAEKWGCRAALLNPAVHPHTHFARFKGPQTNLYTGESFVLTDAHVADLAAMDPPRITWPERYWLFVETGDEVLDYREAVTFYEGALQNVTQGGDHALSTFAQHLPEIVEWAQT